MARVVPAAWATVLASLALASLSASTARAAQATIADSSGVHRGVGGYLSDVAVLSPTDVWAVGAYDLRVGGRRGLIEHWDGSKWSTTVLPPIGTSDALAAVSAISPTDVWAVGRSNDEADLSTVVQHWDGTGWTRVDSPSPPGNDGGGSLLNDVFALADDDVWAVGASDPQTLEWRQCLIEHWDGVEWTTVPCPHHGLQTGNSLSALSFQSATDGWAVGYYERGYGKHLPWTEHWNGKKWRWVESEIPVGRHWSDLNDVVSVASNDVWVVGLHNFDGSFFEHWDGSSWSIVDGPPAGTSSWIEALSATSPTDVWAVGGATSRQGHDKTLVEHWDGTNWIVMARPRPPGWESGLSGVSALSPGEVWAVGVKTSRPDSPHDRQLAGHWNGTWWRWY